MPRHLRSSAGGRHQIAASMASRDTETLRGDSTVRGSSENIDMIDVGKQAGGAESDKRFIIAIDFGTTFSSISFLALPNSPGENEELNTHMLIDKIESIGNFPKELLYGMQASRKDVPSEIWYAKMVSKDLNIAEGRNYRLDIDDFDDPYENQPHNGNDDPDDDVNMEFDEYPDDEENTDTFWGYEVQTRLKLTDTNRNQNRRMSRFKLLLDQSQHTDQVRQDLGPNCIELKRREIIKEDEDVIGDYLTYLFKHAKTELVENHDFSDNCPVEFVLCVPPIWTPKATRIMQDNMQRAIIASDFGRVENRSVDNLFIVSEPEAAAAYVLARGTSVFPKETFVLIDAGGGTVDAITYTVDSNYPLRLKVEDVPATGDLCGSSYLNEAYREHLRTRLEGETYLEDNGQTIESIIDSLVIDFENQLKRSVDVTKPIATEVVLIPGLRVNTLPEKRFTKNRLRLESNDIKAIFLPLLKRVAALMLNQLNSARERKINVKKVLLIGGFANSPSLKSFLTNELKNMENFELDKTKLIVLKAADTAISSGAVLRALNKKDGPKRISRSSYGFLCTEEFNPKKVPEHKGMRSFKDSLDNIKYLRDTINWLINKGDEIPATKEYSMNTFLIFDTKERTRFESKNFLYVSDKKTESHYQKNHKKNKDAGASVIGTIEIDMTFLKDNNIIQPVEAGEDKGDKWERHYQVEYELVMTVNDRNMSWEARYPIGGEVQGKTGQVCIAAAFVPGTK